MLKAIPNSSANLRRRYLATVAAFMAVSLAASLQLRGQPADPSPLASISGTLFDDEGQPLAGATAIATAVRTQASYLAVTGENGEFVLPDLPPARYTVRAEHLRFLTTFYGALKPGRPGAAIDLDPGQQMSGVELTLLPGAVIAGTITNVAGEPLSSVRMELLNIAYRDGGAELTSALSRSFLTNDLGEYRFYGLNPGRYYVHALYIGQMEGGALVDISEDPTEPKLGYPPQYYPGVTRLDQARIVEVGMGEYAEDIDIRMQPGDGVVIKGRVEGAGVNPDGRPFALQFSVAGISTARVAVVGIEPDGSFEIPNVFPGEYWLHTGGAGVAGVASETRATVQVGATPVNLTLRLKLSVTLSGNISVRQGGEADLSSVRLTMLPTDGFAMSSPEAQSSPAGDFTFPPVSSDSWELSISGLPEGMYVESASLGDQDAWHGPFDVGVDSEDLQVVIAGGAASMNGNVTEASGAPLSAATVALIPDDPELQTRERFIRWGTSLPDGSFALHGIPPGDYKLFAWEDIEPQSWTDPSILSEYESSGIRVMLTNSATETLDITAIAPE